MEVRRVLEQLEGAGQLPLSLEELTAIARAESDTDSVPAACERPVRRKHFPEHFERIEEVIEPEECRCPECGGALKAFGTADEAEVLEVKTVTSPSRATSARRSAAPSARPSCRRELLRVRSRRASPEPRSSR